MTTSAKSRILNETYRETTDEIKSFLLTDIASLTRNGYFGRKFSHTNFTRYQISMLKLLMRSEGVVALTDKYIVKETCIVPLFIIPKHFCINCVYHR